MSRADEMKIDLPMRRTLYIRLARLGETFERKGPIREGISSENGASLVETALSFMVVVLVFFGVMEICLALYTYNFVSEAAHEATRYGVIHGSSSSVPKTNQSDFQAYVTGLGFPGINAANTTVTPSWPTTGSTCTPSSIPCNNPGNTVKVVVQYQFPLSIPFMSNSTLVLSSTSQMVISQ